MPGVLARRPPERVLEGRVVGNPNRESRFLTFISPPVGAYTQALQDWASSDPEGAMRQATVWTCVNKVALSMSVMRPLPYSGPVVGFGQATRLPPGPMLSKPSSDRYMGAFTYSAWLSLMLRGNVYGIIAARDPFGLPLQIELQHPDQMRVRRLQHDTTGQKAGEYEYRLRNTVVDPAKVWHKAIFQMPGSRVGMSPIEYAARTTRTTQAAEQFGLSWFEDGGHPSGLLTNANKPEIKQEQAQGVKARFMAAVRGSREPVVLGDGWKYDQISVKAEESQFLNTIQATASDICKFFLMKPQHAGIAQQGSAITYANIEDNMLDFLAYPMTPWMQEYETWLAEWVPSSQYVKLDSSPLLRTDMLSRMQAYHMMIGSRAFTQDEIREMEDRPPLTPEQKAEIDAMPMVPPIPGPKSGS
jgi:HK97 family phage portal protein